MTDEAEILMSERQEADLPRVEGEEDLNSHIFDMKKISNRQIIISVLSGCVANIITDLSYYPLDTLKTRMQASSNRVNYVSESKKISVFKGLSSMMLASLPCAITFFFVYDKSKQVLSRRFDNLNPSIVQLISASLAESSAAFVRNPLEVIKQQMQIGLSPNIYKTVQEIVQKEGLKGLWAGYLTLVLREIPFSAIQFPIYEYLKRDTLEKKGSLDYYSNAKNGAISASIAAFLTNPIDVVKTRLMTQRDRYYKNTLHAIKRMYAEEGINVFLKGIHIRTLTISFTGIVFFGSYEKAKKEIAKII